MEVECTNCFKKFKRSLSQLAKSKNYYCSRSCSATNNNKKFPKRKKENKICSKCSKQYIGRSKSCFECRKSSETIKLKTLQEYYDKSSVKHKHPSWKGAHVRGFNRSWNKKLLKNGCKICGYKIHVELAHIKSVSSFPLSATIGEINSPENVIPLCPNHHWEFDNNILKIETT